MLQYTKHPKNIHVLRCSKKIRKAHSRYVAAVCLQGRDLHLFELDNTNSSWSVDDWCGASHRGSKKNIAVDGPFCCFFCWAKKKGVNLLGVPVKGLKERDCWNSLLKNVCANSVCFFKSEVVRTKQIKNHSTCVNARPMWWRFICVPVTFAK